jgi:hypothetical protein
VVIHEILTTKFLRGRPAVSHISRKTSEMWGTRLLVTGWSLKRVDRVLTQTLQGGKVVPTSVGEQLKLPQ